MESGQIIGCSFTLSVCARLARAHKGKNLSSINDRMLVFVIVDGGDDRLIREKRRERSNLSLPFRTRSPVEEMRD